MPTEKQQSILDELRKISRGNVYSYQRLMPSLHQEHYKQLAKGDQACAFGLGGLTFQVGKRQGISTQSVLSAFKVLERKGLVLRETLHPDYQRPLYWWPVGLAAELTRELLPTGEVSTRMNQPLLLRSQ
jgi:hypothetical protein